MNVYFDNASTTPLSDEVKKDMIDIIENVYGNPSSIHALGRMSKIIVEDARTLIANILAASTGEIFFTSCATEANNMALLGAVRDLNVKHIISSPLEHHCNLHMFDYLSEQHQVEMHYLEVESNGQISPDKIKQKIASLKATADDKLLVSIMHGNNEIGIINNIKSIGEICKDANVLFHTDTAQTMGKLPIDLSVLNISFLCGSAHKFFGPKGAGFVYINSNNLIKPMMHGGGQERDMRSGTENIVGIKGMATALSVAITNMQARENKILAIRDYFIERLKGELADIQFNTDFENSLPNILSVSFPYTDKVDMLIMNLDINGICASSGSACSSGVEHDSHVLQHIGHDNKRKTIRFSFSHFNTKEEVDYVMSKLKTLTPLQ